MDVKSADIVHTLQWKIYRDRTPGMLSPRGQHGLKAKLFGLDLGLVVSGLGLDLGLVQRWPRSHLGWPCGKSSNSGHE